MSMEKFMRAWTGKSGCWCGRFNPEGTQFGYCSEVLFTVSKIQVGKTFPKEDSPSMPLMSWVFIFNKVKIITPTTVKRIEWVFEYMGYENLTEQFEYEEGNVGGNVGGSVEGNVEYTPRFKRIKQDLTKEGLSCTL